MRKISAFVLALVAIVCLFAGCDSTLRDNLGTVTIGAGKSLSASADIPDTQNLTWKYTAEKTSGFWRTGEQLTETEFTFGTSLGSFSTDGTWEFTIFGYNAESVLVYKGSKDDVTVTADESTTIGIDVESQLDEGEVVFGAITFTPGAAYAGIELKLVISDGKSVLDVEYPNATIDATGKATFNFAAKTSEAFDDGEYTFIYTVQSADGLLDLAEGTISFAIYKGYTVTISGDVSSLEQTGEVVINQYVAKSGSTSYYSLADALDAAGTGYATLLKNNSEAIDADANVELNGFGLVNTVVASGKTLTVKVKEGSIYTYTDGTISIAKVGLEVVVTTVGGTLTIDAPDDTVRHSGTADVVDVNAVASNSYHLDGSVKVLSVMAGRVVLEDDAQVKTVIVDATAKEDFSIVVSADAVVEQVASSKIDVADVQSVITGAGAAEAKASVFVTSAAAATVDDIPYGDIALAFANADGTTVVLASDVVIVGNDGIVVPAGKTVVLDLNGFTLTNAVNENKSSQVITNRGTLTIKSSVDGGVLCNGIEAGTSAGDWWSVPQLNYASNVITNCGTLTVLSGTIENTAVGSLCYAIDNNNTTANAVLNINGGKLVNTHRTTVRMYCNSTTFDNNVVVTAGEIEGSYAGLYTMLPGSTGAAKKASVTISGGSFSGTYAWYDYSFGDIYTNVSYDFNGGEFDGYVWSYGKTGFITGGTFTMPADGVEDLEKYLPDGYKASFAEGSYSVSLDPDVVATKSGETDVNMTFTQFASKVNAGNDFAGWTVTLIDDVDFQNTEWKTIGTSGKPFSGAFDGNNKKIANATISGTNQYSALFGAVAGATIKNLSLENIDVTASPATDGCVAFLVATANGAVIENVDISSDCSILSTSKYIAGFVAYAPTGNLTFTDCSNAATISSNNGSNNYRIGGYVCQLGTTGGTSSFTGCSFSGSISTPSDKGWAGGFIAQKVSGGGLGTSLEDPTVIAFTNCASTGTIAGLYAGSFIGNRTYDYMAFIGCSDSLGAITAPAGLIGRNEGFGAIVVGSDVYLCKGALANASVGSSLDFTNFFRGGYSSSIASGDMDFHLADNVEFSNGELLICGGVLDHTDFNVKDGYKVQQGVFVYGYDYGIQDYIKAFDMYRIVPSNQADGETYTDVFRGEAVWYDQLVITSGLWKQDPTDYVPAGYTVNQLAADEWQVVASN